MGAVASGTGVQTLELASAETILTNSAAGQMIGWGVGQAGAQLTTPASKISGRLELAAAIPTTRLAVETMPSFAPSTDARSQPMRSVRWIDWQHGDREDRQKFAQFLMNPQNLNMYSYVTNNPTNQTDPTGMKGCQAGDKKFSECTITITYDPKTSKGTLTVTGQNKGDKNPTTLLTSNVVVGGDGHVTPTGTFTATVWEKDHVSTKYGDAANTPWSKTVMGGNAFGPYQLHMKELDSKGIYIHGTMGPGWSPTTWGNSIFLSPTSHGCVRMCNRDDIKLHDIMPNPSGNKVIIGTKPEDED